MTSKLTMPPLAAEIKQLRELIHIGFSVGEDPL